MREPAHEAAARALRAETECRPKSFGRHLESFRISQDAAQAQAVTGTNELSCLKRSVPFVRSTRSW